MAKPEWGAKRVCQSCASKFYDLNRAPILCPNCGAVFDVEALSRVRRSRSSPVKAAAAAAVLADDAPAEAAELADGAEVIADFDEDAVVDEEIVEAAEDDDEEEALIEDTAELGDDDELSDVIDSNLDEEER